MRAWKPYAWLAAPLLAAVAMQACVGDIGDTPPLPPGLQPTLEPSPLARLTARQYRNAVTDLLGEDLAAVELQPDTNPYLFYSIGATSTPLSEHGVQQLEEAATKLTQQLFADPQRREALVGCVPTAPADDCSSDFISSFGRRVYRRPLTSDEHARWLGISSSLSDGDAWQGLSNAVAGMLQSHHFIYHVELGEEDPAAPERLRYTAYEMASRLSFLLWNTTPDDTLLAAAKSGELLTAAGVEKQARRLIDDPRARGAVQDFFAQYFDLSRLDGLSRDPATYPQATPTLTESMRTEVKLLVDDFVYRSDSDIREIFSTRRTFVNSDLAALYGIEAEGASPIAFVPVTLPDDGPRAGILTFGAFLAMNAHETETSPTLRGKYVRERVLCQSVPPPPDDIDLDITPKPGDEPKTLRERLELHRDDPKCNSCHAFIDPPGFLFEHFDPVGAYRDKEGPFPIDASGDIDGVPLDGARDLAELLKGDDRVGRCIVKQLYRHAQGRLDEKTEDLSIEQIHSRFADSGYRFRELLVALVGHQSFRFIAYPEDQP